MSTWRSCVVAHTRLWPAALFLALLGLGCENGTGPSFTGLRIRSGGAQEGTPFSVAPAPLVVELHDSTGAAQAGVPILLESISSGLNGPRLMFQRTDTSIVGARTITINTDRNGLVSVRVAFQRDAGDAWVRVSAPSFGLEDSTRFVLNPGPVVSVTLQPSDTAVLVGGVVTLRGAQDAWGNLRNDLMTWSASPPNIVEVAAPGQIRGLHTGRAVVRAQIGTTTDSVALNVVPPGRIAAMFMPIAVGAPEYFVLFNTDGTGYQRLDVGADCAHGLQWAPASDQIVFGRNPAPGICFTQRLYSTSLTGNVQKILADTTLVAGEFWPRLTADGQWIYFMGRPGSQNGEIWRLRSNGTGAERIGPAAGFYDLDQQPSPSPDGTEVVYTSARASDTASMLRIIDTTTRTPRDLGVPGVAPSWSPRGDQIAFERAQRYYVIAADGSGERGLADARYSGVLPDSPSWSADGNWIVAVVVDPHGYAPLYGRLALIEVGSGVVLPLGWTSQLTYPTWRP